MVRKDSELGEAGDFDIYICKSTALDDLVSRGAAEEQGDWQ